MPRVIAVFLCSLAFAPCLAQAATNLIVNPHFDAGFANWQPLVGVAPASLSWSALDEGGKPASGSLRLANLDSFATSGVVSDCFAVSPGAPIVFGASAYGQQGPDPNQPARGQLVLWDGPNCSGANVGQLQSDLQYGLGVSTWGPIQGYGQVPAAAESAQLILSLSVVEEAPPTQLYFDNAFVFEQASCASTSTVVCLNDRRFRAQINWLVPDGTRGYGVLAPFTADSARSTFFNPANVEVVLKVLDGCAANQRFWIFAAGLTNVQVSIKVKDTHTGASWSHLNPLDQPFAPVQDTSAFEGCPH